MKRLLLYGGIIAVLLITYQVHAAPPSRSHTYTAGSVIEPAEVTTNEDNIYEYLQSGVDTIADNSVETSDIQNAAVTTAKIDTSAVTTTQIADDTIINSDISSTAAINGSKIADDEIDAEELDETDDYTWTGAHDFGGGTIEVDNQADCSAIATDGQLCWDSDDELLYVGDGSAPPVLSTPASTANTFTLTTAAAEGSATTFVRTDASLAIFNADTPEPLGTAAAGTTAFCSRVDHVHSGFTYQVETDSGSSAADEDIITVGAGKTWILQSLKIEHEAASNTDAEYFLKFTDDSTASLGTLAAAGDTLYATDGGHIILDSAGAFDTTTTLTNFDGDTLKAISVERAGGSGTADYDIEMLVIEY